MPRQTFPTRILMTGLLLVGMAACKPSPAPENVVEEANGLIPELPTETTMDRAALLTAVSAAASDYAAGVDDRQAQGALDGKRFEFRIPFGCVGDVGTPDHNLKLVVRPGSKAYEASATLDIGLSDVMAFFPEPEAKPAAGADNAVVANEAQPAAPHIEAAEGYWIGRPWMLGAQCPATALAEAASDEDAAAPPSPAPPQPTVGIVQYYGAADSRVGLRGGKPLTKVQPISASKAPPSAGAVFLIQGRLRHWPTGKVILCRGDAAAARPQCLISATIDRMAFQRADNGATIAEWTR